MGTILPRQDLSVGTTTKRITVVMDNGGYAKPLGRQVRKRWTGWQLIVSGMWTSFPCGQGRCALYFSQTKDGLYYGLRRGRSGPIVAVAVVEGQPCKEEIAAALMRAVARSGGPYVESFFYFGEGFDSDLLWRLYCARD